MVVGMSHPLAVASTADLICSRVGTTGDALSSACPSRICVKQPEAGFLMLPVGLCKSHSADTYSGAQKPVKLQLVRLPSNSLTTNAHQRWCRRLPLSIQHSDTPKQHTIGEDEHSSNTPRSKAHWPNRPAYHSAACL